MLNTNTSQAMLQELKHNKQMLIAQLRMSCDGKTHARFPALNLVVMS